MLARKQGIDQGFRIRLSLKRPAGVIPCRPLCVYRGDYGQQEWRNLAEHARRGSSGGAGRVAPHSRVRLDRGRHGRALHRYLPVLLGRARERLRLRLRRRAVAGSRSGQFFSGRRYRGGLARPHPRDRRGFARGSLPDDVWGSHSTCLRAVRIRSPVEPAQRARPSRVDVGSARSLRRSGCCRIAGRTLSGGDLRAELGGFNLDPLAALLFGSVGAE